jgi:hypothetical protein
MAAIMAEGQGFRAEMLLSKAWRRRLPHLFAGGRFLARGRHKFK